MFLWAELSGDTTVIDVVLLRIVVFDSLLLLLLVLLMLLLLLHMLPLAALLLPDFSMHVLGESRLARAPPIVRNVSGTLGTIELSTSFALLALADGIGDAGGIVDFVGNVVC